MWDWKVLTFISVLILLSLLIIVKKPQMHKQAVFTDSEYGFVDEDTSFDQVDIQNRDIKITVIPSETGSQSESREIDIQNKNIPTRNIKVTTAKEKPTKSGYKNTTSPQKNNVTKPSQQQLPMKNEQNQSKEKPTEKAKPANMAQETKPEQKQTTKPVLTEQEEIIAWNHWRSRLQNQVMMDSKISAPLGTQFKFTFTVDKYGNMSNVKVWSTNPSYSDLAVRVIKPVLMSYRNKPILNFPYGTKRIITNVEGGFVISRISRYSSPSDYNDYERVKR